MRTFASVLICLSLFQLEACGELSIETDFPGGSADVQNIDSKSGTIQISPHARTKRGWPCWWYFKVTGATKGQGMTLELAAVKREFRAGRVLSSVWSQPQQAAISVDNVHWSQTPKCQKKNGIAAYAFSAPADSFWLAWGPPFLPSHADQLLKSLKAKLPDSTLFDLAKTRGGRTVHGIRIGDKTKATKKYGVWVQARQHAWEAGSSWVGKGFVDWLASADPTAVKLRSSADIYFVPIMDVDNVAIGAGGKDAAPRDHNRDWDDKPNYPEVAAAQKRIAQLNAEGKFDVFIDLHNPSAGARRPFFFGPINLDMLAAVQQRNHARWLALCANSISGPLQLEPRYKFATYVKTDEERNRMSANWVRNHTNTHVMSTTLETAWNTPNSNTKGYRQVGAQLGTALARYLESKPRASTDSSN